MGAKCAEHCLLLGYANKTTQLGYQTFLYGTENELRNILMFLVDKLPKGIFSIFISLWRLFKRLVYHFIQYSIYTRIFRKFLMKATLEALVIFLNLLDSSSWNKEDDISTDLKTATKAQILNVIGHQISNQHEWLPQTVIGDSGLRPFDQSIQQHETSGSSGIYYSREGVRGVIPFNSSLYLPVLDAEVKNEEWEVSQLMANSAYR